MKYRCHPIQWLLIVSRGGLCYLDSPASCAAVSWGKVQESAKCGQRTIIFLSEKKNSILWHMKITKFEPVFVNKALLERNCDQPRQHIKKQRHYFANTGLSCQGHGFSSAHVWMWELDYKESWAPKNWCFWTLESLSDCKEIQKEIHPKGDSVHPKGDQSWVFIGRTDVEAETPIVWPPDPKSWLTGKDPDAGKDWG